MSLSRSLAAASLLSVLACACSSKSDSEGLATTSGGAAGSVLPPGQAGAGVAGVASVAGTTGAAGTRSVTSGRAGSAGVQSSPGVGGASGVTGAAGGNAAVGGAVAATAGASAAGAGQPGTSGAGAAAPSGSDEALWIATTGADSNPGTEAMPLATLAAAVAKATPGTTIWVGPGEYRTTDTVVLSAKASEEKPIKVLAQPGAARPVLDFSAQPRGDSGSRGIEISGDYWHLRGLDIVKAGDNCIHVGGAHNTLEWLVTHDCFDTGIQISANGSEAGDASRAANNLVLNCDSYANYDAQNNGENADGFAAKLYIGPGNVFRGCRAWNNADDGWDLFASDDVVVIEDCWAIANGKIGSAQNNTNGDGNGFKLGGAARAGDANMGGAPHEVKGCYSVENRACGFVRNNNTDTPRLSMYGGRGDGKGLLCSLTGSGEVPVTISAAAAIAAERDADGNLPAMP